MVYVDNARRKFIWWLHRLSGRDQGERMAWWVLVVWCLVRPIGVIQFLAARVWDPWTDCYTLHGHRVSGELITAICVGPLPSQWFRFVRDVNGSVSMQVHQDPLPGGWEQDGR